MRERFRCTFLIPICNLPLIHHPALQMMCVYLGCHEQAADSYCTTSAMLLPNPISLFKVTETTHLDLDTKSRYPIIMFIIRDHLRRCCVLGSGALLLSMAVGAVIAISLVRSQPSQMTAATGDAEASHSYRDSEKLPAFLVRASRPSPEALRQTESTPRGGEFRYSDFSLSLVARGGSPISQSILRLCRIGCRQCACPQPTLEVLFCTWQT